MPPASLFNPLLCVLFLYINMGISAQHCIMGISLIVTPSHLGYVLWPQSVEVQFMEVSILPPFLSARQLDTHPDWHSFCLNQSNCTSGTCLHQPSKITTVWSVPVVTEETVSVTQFWLSVFLKQQPLSPLSGGLLKRLRSPRHHWVLCCNAAMTIIIGKLG